MTKSFEQIDKVDLEVELVMTTLKQMFGYDFSGYNRAPLKSRLLSFCKEYQVDSVIDIVKPLLHSPSISKELISYLTVTVTEMFRDPVLYQFLREYLPEYYQTKPYVKIWHIGCSSGQEVISLSILLQELNLLGGSKRYATDLNPMALEKAKRSSYQLANLKLYIKNYLASGGSHEFSKYYVVENDSAVFLPQLVFDVKFAQHDIVAEPAFTGADIIFCRNVMMYFTPQQHLAVVNKLVAALPKGGLLCIGLQEYIPDEVKALRKLKHGVPIYERIA
ncbi:CheR family methyltransferase [Catenovulum agarivorans]|uniref:CheR family methyltransferase n=1 Tax=Catenovulum agarivorans TaxID=1172192 RepID=UPI0002E9E685|nr:CheR family methyltransferase [Catenovulum agarivorans]